MEKVHSDEYIHAKSRDFWWNDDYFQLLIRRFGISEIESIADIGCGNGYLCDKLLGYIPGMTHVYGIDREQASVEEAAAKFEKRDVVSKFFVGDAHAIPMADDSVDLAICQTLLIHVARPIEVIKEMLRITKKGGCVIALEPNNNTQALINTKYINEPEMSIEDRLEEVEFTLRTEKGKERFGEGYNSQGDFIPLLFNEAGVKDIKVYQNDKALPLIPPHDDEAQSVIDDEISWIRTAQSVNDYREMKRYYLNGGGDESKFESYWEKLMKRNERHIEYCRDKRFYSPGSHVFYVVGGSK